MSTAVSTAERVPWIVELLLVDAHGSALHWLLLGAVVARRCVDYYSVLWCSAARRPYQQRQQQQRGGVVVEV